MCQALFQTLEIVKKDTEKALLLLGLHVSWGRWVIKSEQINEQIIYLVTHAMKDGNWLVGCR